ncbi:bifunctional UDP-sugar hydrolase/5'-nucleotidase (plasmid) [Pseudoalteromonas lipolytica]|uniref:5'-nucleotidase / UDP-sugar diphosphatase n=1 Tax=Pseudoalteromonas lipolytica TaxID=570156 RepID=A0AAD0S301_9GAMM|nr:MULTISPECIES: bifunctional UDP-sugar hydrolase/5'-nucleotidase UshA [Pseudoalteromonas]AXV67203.1 bifunctional UDP-sugar hydrolase/5'-nucleotidase [Pseudoalteromonas donghaensis]MBE0353319.1 5'-nucleotidase / UDP-sugar diphosphatase [Pseudoalteromonas lipolytica LMEB 39]QLJ10389.1 bifunctional UDP-sugar hydrolase/5'-nucleotidase [Pseudoalteromonas sp. JSTW]QMW16584.1 bifunctional UDP-sugar hydrolase/5'-nucleotidase [Pseudoalteromonas sp. MT33b]SFT74141.1 5'-nucleotidase / UDP-sugar diphosph
MRFFILSSLLVTLTACSSSSNHTDSVQYLTLLHTNDNHGRFWHNEQGEYGMAARKTLIDRLKAEAVNNGHAVLLLSGGDINTGIPESDLQHAEPDFKGMSAIGYDAMAIGNHEFDNPLAVLDKQQQWSNFPFLSANIFDKETGKTAYQAYEVFEKNGLKIAVIGLTTTDTAKIGNPQYIGGLDFQDPVTVTTRLAPKIEAQYNPDITIAVTHMGHYVDANYGINAPGDVTMARNLPKGMIDIIVGGHSQEPVCMSEENVADVNFAPGKACKPDQQNGTWIMQAHEWGKYVGKAEFKLEGDELTLLNYSLIPVNLYVENKEGKKQLAGDYIEPDKSLKNMLAVYQEKGAAQIAGKIGEVDSKLEGDRNKVRYQQVNLARVIIAAQMQSVGADFGIISGGGIRDSIHAGDVSYKDILKVHPFKNRITYIDITGKDLFDYLDVVTSFPPDSGAYLQYHKLSFKRENNQLSDVKINGAPIEMTKTYRMSINSYNASGGDGYPTLTKKAGFVSTDDTDAQALKRYFEQNSPLKAADYAPN